MAGDSGVSPAAGAATPLAGADGEPFAVLAETHTSTLLMLGDRVYKIKKAVKLPFVDLSTRELRLANCRREIELNRRTAPDVYLGVGEFTEPGAEASEPVVVMRRMPAERSLSSLLKAGRRAEAARCVDEVAELIARFHASLDAEKHYDLPGTMASLWREGWEQTQRFARSPADHSTPHRAVAVPGSALVEGGRGEPGAVTGAGHCEGGRGEPGNVLGAGLAVGDPRESALLDREALDETYALATEYLAGRRPMLTAREQAGLVRDGHGDLLADDVYLLADGPRVLDCLEFDRRLRLGDVLLDLAFLMMDLELHGAPELARALVDKYRQLDAGQHPRSLEHHYVAYRAWVRAKVECLRYEAGDPGARERAGAALELARSEARAARVHLVAIGGLPGTGKSTVAREIVESDERDWALLSSDRIRKQLAGLDPTAEVTTAFATGIYDTAHTAATYAEMARRAATALERGVSVILDASWTDSRERAVLQRLATDHHAALTQVRCDAPLDVCRARITARREGPRVSDADHAVLHGMSQHAAPWPEALTLDTTVPSQSAATHVLEALDDRLVRRGDTRDAFERAVCAFT